MRTLRNIVLALTSTWLATSLACASPVLQADSAVVDVGSTFSIDVSVSRAVDVQSFQFDLAYDSTRLRLLGFSDIGTDFDAIASTGFGLLGLTGFDLPGVVSGVADAMVGVAAGAGLGAGVIATFLFQDIAAGSSALTVSAAFLNFSDLGFAVVNGSVTNPAAGSVPEPSTAWLALAALCGMRGVRTPGSARRHSFPRSPVPRAAFPSI